MALSILNDAPCVYGRSRCGTCINESSTVDVMIEEETIEAN